MKITLDVFDANGNVYAEQPTKTFNGAEDYLNGWFERPPANITPEFCAKSALNLQTGKTYNPPWRNDAIGYANLHCNDPQHGSEVSVLSAAPAQSLGCIITPGTFPQVMVQVAVRRLIADTWLNHTDQFQVPTCDLGTYKQNRAPGTTNLPDEFITDCTVWNLFAGHNQSSAWSPEWKGKEWTVDNQFYPYPLATVKGWVDHDLDRTRQIANAKNTWACEWLYHRQHSPEVLALLRAGAAAYAAFYANLPQLMQKKWHLQKWNVGWYQVRMALKEAGITAELDAVKVAHKALADKLRPQVYSLGFLEK